MAIQLGQALYGFFYLRSYWQDWVQVSQTVLETARRVDDRAAEAQAHSDLGVVHWRQGRHDRALACLEDSLAIDRELGDRHGQAETLRDLGVTLCVLGRPEEARAHWRQALAIFERLQSADADQVRALLAGDPG
jgi:tetratricopeptide (TPR) repeat protein